MTEDRERVLAKIIEYEKNEKWDIDVEDDPPTKVLLPNKVDYLGKKPFAKLSSFIANKVAISFYEKLLKNGDMVIKEIVGAENFNVSSGAVITCNHFNAFDNYAVFKAVKPYLKKGHNLYKVIREGNFTNFKGLYGYFFRHCNTLPLSSNTETMIKFMRSVDILLKRGEKILIYPEQAMWWNYKKPRPMKNGAFKFAVKADVPIIPVFITMEDGEKIDGNGCPVQLYTVNVLPAIYPKKDLSAKDNAEYLKNENYNVWKSVYENFYGKPLVYSSESGE